MRFRNSLHGLAFVGAVDLLLAILELAAHTIPRYKKRIQLLIDGICHGGFSSPISIDELRRTRYVNLPSTAGIYVIARSPDKPPIFRPKSTGGWFKGKDPNYSEEQVRENWVDRAQVLYVGMTRARGGLRSRICAFLDFGAGKRRGHRGGRMLWHLEDSEQLFVRWKSCPAEDTNRQENEAIAAFKAVFDGKRPFANMNK